MKAVLMGECPDGMTLDRYPNNDGHYEPGNCRWATYTEQARNQRNTIRVVHRRNRISLRDACDLEGISFATVVARIRNGWPEHRWLQPPRKKSSPRNQRAP